MQNSALLKEICERQQHCIRWNKNERENVKLEVCRLISEQTHIAVHCGVGVMY